MLCASAGDVQPIRPSVTLQMWVTPTEADMYMHIRVYVYTTYMRIRAYTYSL